MGVPKFFRWLSERYPKIVDRYGSPPKKETCEEYYDRPPPKSFEDPDLLSTCGLPPEIDRLYLDMNGILHGCSHNNNGSNTDDDGVLSTTSNITKEEICTNVFYYLDRVVSDLAQPKQLVYMAIDGVAPRAKLNQQRSRRYRSGTEGELEQSIYELHMSNKQREEEERERDNDDSSKFSVFGDDYTFAVDDVDDENDESQEDENVLKEVAGSPGRFKGKFQTQAELETDENVFHSNVITPGTPFFQYFTQELEKFVRRKLATDPKWKELTIIFSGPNVPGEGEHKIMDFMREQQQRSDYDPNLRHCIMGQDGDLIMLGLCTHEPNLVLLRERVIFNLVKRKLIAAHSQSLDAYIHNAHFEFLHMGVLRDYLAYEFETSNVLPSSPWDIERTIDDFIFMTFFVGNDFLPHMPALDIGDGAFDLLFYTYKHCRSQWLEEYKDGGKAPYLTDAGSIVSGKRLEYFLSEVGAHEVAYYDKKKQVASKENARIRKESKKFGHDSVVPDEEVLESKEASDRAAYSQMLKKEMNDDSSGDGDKFTPVLSSSLNFEPTPEEVEKGLVSRMTSILNDSLSTANSSPNHPGGTRAEPSNDQDLKGRYYYDKFNLSPFDAEKHLALRKSYIEGLVWNLKYYYEGCVSWEWYYPYHYGPMLSDLVNLEDMLQEIDFSDKGKPLKPFEQLLGCMPPSQAYHLPEPYRWLMTDPKSPIIDFYPKSFTVDMNGKRWPWEAVALLPFIDSQRLLEQTRKVTDSMLTEEERNRNATGDTLVMIHDPDVVVGSEENEETAQVQVLPYAVSEWGHESAQPPQFVPKLRDGVKVPLPGYGSLRDGPVHSLWRRDLGINVHGSQSRYRTACLEMSKTMLPPVPIESLASKLIGSCIYINYPYFVEAFVTAISDENRCIRGERAPTRWSVAEADAWRTRRDGVLRLLETGEGMTGTGGLSLPKDQNILVSVRPLQDLVTTKDGIETKSFAPFEIDVPLISVFWTPSSPDPRLQNIPARLEKNVYDIATPHTVGTPNKGQSQNRQGSPEKRKQLFPAKNRQPSFLKSKLSAQQNRTFSTWPDHQCLLAGSFNDTRILKRLETTRPTESASRMHVKPLPGTSSKPFLRRCGGTRGRILAVGAAVSMFVLGSSGCHASPHPSDISVSRSPKAYGSNEDHPMFGIDLGLTSGQSQSSSDSQERATLNVAHGTTTLSFVFKGGIVAAVDSRASLGSFVGSKSVQKVIPVSNGILGTMAGGAADCSFWLRKLRAEAMLHELTDNTAMTPTRASRILANCLYRNRGLDLSVGTMIMGLENGGEPKIFYVDNDGVRIGGNMFAVGSGSTYALGILDTEYNVDMNEKEAVALGIKAIRHATFRDAYSGGIINVYVITRDGWKLVFREDVASKDPTDPEQ